MISYYGSVTVHDEIRGSTDFRKYHSYGIVDLVPGNNVTGLLIFDLDCTAAGNCNLDQDCRTHVVRIEVGSRIEYLRGRDTSTSEIVAGPKISSSSPYGTRSKAF